jgi:hypothetical protein
VISIWMTGGTWELQRHNEQYDLACDTPGVRVRLPGAAGVFAVGSGGERIPVQLDASGTFLYPSHCLAVETFE